MKETIAEPREDLKPHAPRIVVMFVPKEMIGAIIGPRKNYSSHAELKPVRYFHRRNR